MKELRQAAKEGNLEKVKELHAQGAKLDDKGSGTERTALHWAAEQGHLNIVEYLVKSGVKIDAEDREENTPLNLAVQSRIGTISNRISVIQFLLDNKANPLAENHKNNTPLMHLASLRNYVKENCGIHQQEAVAELIRQVKQSSETLISVKKEFKELLIKIFTIQYQCKMRQKLQIGVFDPLYEGAVGYNADLAEQNEKLIKKQQELLPRVRELAKQLSIKEHNQITIEAQQEVDQKTAKKNTILELLLPKYSP